MWHTDRMSETATPLDPGGVGQARNGTQAVERAITVLRLFEQENELSLTEIATRTGLNISTAHRIIRALDAAGLLSQDPFTERYHLGLTTAVLGRLASERLGFSTVLPALEAFTEHTGEAINLGVRADQDVVILIHVASPHALRFEQQPGTRNPAHVCAMGKVLLALGPPSLVPTGKLQRFTPNTITTRQALDAELQRIREQGYAINDEERTEGVRAVAAPVFGARGEVVAAIAAQGPTVRFSDDQLPALIEQVLATATSIGAGGLPDRLANPA